jgi:hypothetical protein
VPAMPSRYWWAPPPTTRAGAFWLLAVKTLSGSISGV